MRSSTGWIPRGVRSGASGASFADERLPDFETCPRVEAAPGALRAEVSDSLMLRMGLVYGTGPAAMDGVPDRFGSASRRSSDHPGDPSADV